ncbi:MAG: hypothetical protein ACWGON_09870 [Gemmatimonadota bacterium]
MRFLSGSPVSLWAGARRTRGELNGLFGQETTTEVEGFDVGATFRSPYLNANVSYNENQSDNMWSSPTTAPMRRIQDRSMLLLNVTNSKTRVREIGFLRYRTLATNRQRWGKGSSLLSRLNYSDQSGSGTAQSFLWGQNAHLQHTALISTDLRYSVTDVKSPVEHIKGWTAGFNEMVRVSRELAFLLDGLGSRQTASVGSVQNWRIQPKVQINTMIPAGFRLSVGAGVGYRWRNQDTGAGGTGTVIGEQHVVPSSGRFLLDELYTNPATVRITSEDGSILYDPGADYRLFESSGFMEVIVLAGGRILTGESLLVDYEYTVFGSDDTQYLSWQYGLNLQWKGWQLYHSFATDDQVKSSNPLSPDVGENRNAIAGIRCQSATPVGALSVTGEWRETTQADGTTALVLLEADLGFQISERWRGSAGAGWSTRSDGVRYDLARAFGRVSWRTSRTLQTYADVSANAWERPGSSERFIGGAIGVDWSVGLMTVGARLEHSHLDSGPDRVRTRFSIRASRKF